MSHILRCAPHFCLSRHTPAHKKEMSFKPCDTTLLYPTMRWTKYPGLFNTLQWHTPPRPFHIRLQMKFRRHIQIFHWKRFLASGRKCKSPLCSLRLDGKYTGSLEMISAFIVHCINNNTFSYIGIWYIVPIDNTLNFTAIKRDWTAKLLFPSSSMGRMA